MLFKECPHSDDKQRLKLSQQLGLKPRQVKFWFQNRRTQLKLERLSCIAAGYTSRPMQSLGPTAPLLLPSPELDKNIYSSHFPDIVSAAPPLAPDSSQAQFNGVIIMDQNKGLALDLAMTASEQLVRLCTMNEPLWVKGGGGRMAEVLDVEEYGRLFQWPVELKQEVGVTVEATRDSGIVMVNSITLVDAFLDANKWMELFPTIVSKAKTLPIVTTGISGHGNGSLHLVMWVEHADVEDKPVHRIFDQLVRSGVAFGATRWLSILQRQCERHASFMARNISDLGVIPTLEARKNIMKLSQRMVKTFCANISSSNNQSWTALSELSDDTIRVTTRKNTEPGQPNGVILTAVSTTWLPFSHQQVLDLLTNEQRRSQLDALSNGNSLHEITHIANGSHQRNCVSLLRINASSNSSQNVELLLQEGNTHQIGGSILVYATMDVDAVQVAMSGEDPSYISLLPTGFVLLPVPPPNSSTDANTIDGTAGAGCLLTIGMQVLASTIPSAKLSLSSITSINNQLSNAVHQITAALGGGGGGNADADVSVTP